MCPCGGTIFKTLISLDPEDFTVGWYTLQGYCYECDSKVTLACEADLVG